MGGRFTDTFVQEVKDANPVEAVIGETVPLERAGRALRCCSPLRKDRNPSFYVYPDQGLWWDFGTSEGGDVVEYVERRYGLGFLQAIDWLMARAGIPRPEENGQDPDSERRAVEALSERRMLYGIMREAFNFYHSALPDRIRVLIREQWGINDDSIEKHQIGWAPGGTALADFLINECGHSPDVFQKTGLFFKRASGELVDFYQSRIVFPYFVGGEAVYSIGRRVEGRTPDADYEQTKYKKQLVGSDKRSWISPLISNDWLFGEDHARRKCDSLIVAEGVTDCIVADQLGLPTVSFVTIQPNAKQRERLAGLTSRTGQVIIANDAEENASGMKGALATAEILYRSGRDVRITEFRRGDGLDKIDLVELVKSGGKEALERALSSAQSFFALRLRAISLDISAQEAEAEIRELCSLAATRGPIERYRCVSEIAKKMKTPRGNVSRVIVDFIPKPQTKELGLKGRVHLDENDCYYTETVPGQREFVSNFTMSAKEVLISERGESISVELRSQTGEVESRVLGPSAWSSRRSFVEAVGCSHRSFTGNDENVQAIRALLNQSRPPVRRGSEMIGYHELPDGSRVWVTEDGVFDRDGDIDPQPIYYVPGASALEKRFAYPRTDDNDVRSVAAEVLPRIASLNEPQVMQRIIGWFFAVPLAPRIQRVLGHFPLLWIFGSAGTGKTTLLREVFWPLSGAQNRNMFSVTDTEFALYRTLSGGSGVPVLFDEWRPSDMPKNAQDRMNRTLRVIYNGSSVQRGQRDLSLRSWTLSAPVAIAGEAPPEDPAVIERTIQATLDKNALTATRRSALEIVRRFDLSLLTRNYLRFSLGIDFNVELTVARAFYSQTCGDIALPDRVRDNMLCMTLGLLVFEKWANGLGVEFGNDLDLTKTIREIALSSIEGGEVGFVKDAFDRFIEDLSTMAHRGLLVEGTHYSFQSSMGHEINLHLSSCYQVYLNEKHHLGQKDETNGYTALKRVAKEKSERDSYVVGQRRVPLGNSYVRALTIDQKKIPEGLDVTEFPRRRLTHPEEDVVN